MNGQNDHSDSIDDVSALPLGKYLASSDKAVRDKAVMNLKSYLVAQEDNLLSQKEMNKLWKGLFYCKSDSAFLSLPNVWPGYWHSDKPLVQQDLARDLAELVVAIPLAPSALHFLRGFWEMIMQEWTRIDHYRLDKFYNLIRQFVNAAFRLQIRENWERLCCEANNHILTSKDAPLNPENPRRITSIACHLGDIYLDELEKAGKSSHCSAIPILEVTQPLITYMAHTESKATFTRLQEAFMEPLLQSFNLQDAAWDPQAGKHPFILAHSSTGSDRLNPSSAAIVRKALLDQLFAGASEETAREWNRKEMYGIWKASVNQNGSRNVAPDGT